MEDRTIERERTLNVWSSFARKSEALDRATQLEALPAFGLDQIGGLAEAKEEIQTYACAISTPALYERWGTYPPSGLLLIGAPGVGKRLLAKALASLTGTSFLDVHVPHLVIEVIHRGGKVGELLNLWSQSFAELPRMTVHFKELEFSQAQELGARRPDLPVGPVMDFLLDMVDRAIAVEGNLVVGSTSHPDTLRQAFSQPGRFERIVEVNPVFPDDVIEVLRLHADQAEKRAGHPLFDGVEWRSVVTAGHQPSPGAWVHILHAVLRRKARCEAMGEDVSPVKTQDLLDEVERFQRASHRIAMPTRGNYV